MTDPYYDVESENDAFRHGGGAAHGDKVGITGENEWSSAAI